MGIYPYYVFRNRVDIIDMEGHVMKPGLYGNVKMEGDVFIGEDSRGRRDYWDAKGGRHYGSMPQFGRILRFEVARDGEQIYMRQLEKGWEKPFTKDSVLLHERYVIMGNKLIFLDDTRKAYEICGYERGCVYIQACWKRDERYKYASVGPTGTITAYEHELPGRLRTTPVDIGMMKLKRMS